MMRSAKVPFLVLALCAVAATARADSPPTSAERHPDGPRPELRLRNAASRGHLDELTALLKTGVAVDQRFDRGETALMLAARKGHTDIVKALLDARAKPNLVDDDGRSALHRAAAAGALPVATMLLIRGAKPDLKSNHGTTPLFEAAMAGEADIVRMLLGKRADPMARDLATGDTAFIRAANGGHVAVLRALLATADVNATNKQGETALMHAARNGRMPAVELLLANGAKLDARNAEGMSAAALARRGGHGFVATALEKRGAVLSDSERSDVETLLSERRRQRFFPDRVVERCRGGRAGRRYLEICAESHPAERGRRFVLAVRDTSGLEPGVSPQTAKHRLVVATDVPAAPDEYLDLDHVECYHLGGSMHVLLASVVHGMPGEHDHGRASLYVFDDQTGKLAKAWDSHRCGPPCNRQTLTLRRRPGETWPTVIYEQTVGAETHETPFAWNGHTLVPKR